MNDRALFTVGKALLESFGGQLQEGEVKALSASSENPLVWAQCVSGLANFRALRTHSEALSEASADHVKALSEASEAAEKHALALVWATRVLAGATVALVVATIVLVLVTAASG